MTAVIALLVIVTIIAMAILALLALVTFGIHGDERHMSLKGIPPTRASFIARRVLGTYSTPKG